MSESPPNVFENLSTDFAPSSIDTLNAGPDAPPVPVAFCIRDEKTANWLVRKVMESRQYRIRVKLWAEEEIARAQAEEDRLLYLFGHQLRDWCASELEKIKSRRKTLHLPAGQAGFRHVGAKLVIDDEETVMQWARQHLPVAIQKIEKLVRSMVSDHFDANGEIPTAGAHVEPAHESFSIR